MKIAFFVSSFPLVSETFILNQVTGLLDLGHDVDIFAEYRPDSQQPIHPSVFRYALLDKTVYMQDFIPPSRSSWNEIPLWPIDGKIWIDELQKYVLKSDLALESAPILSTCLLKEPRITYTLLDRDLYGEQSASLSAIYRLHALMSSGGSYDILHVHFGPNGNTFRFTKELFQAPYIVSFHGYDFSQAPKEHGTGMYRDLFRVADLVTANSRYAMNCLEGLGCQTEKMLQLNVGINAQDFTFRERELDGSRPIRFLTVGRLVEKKGIEYSIRAAAMLGNDGIDFQYDILGGGPLRNDLLNLIRELDLTEQVFLHGAQTTEAVRDFMEKADIFVLASVTSASSDQEGTPVVLMEAQACGLPVVSTLHSGIPEVVLNNSSGFLVPERDTVELASAMKRMVNCGSAWPTMGRTGRKHVEDNFDLNTLNSSLGSIYKSLCL